MFKKDFVWGAATASYQVEGAYNEDGKGLSIWDTFSREPGKIFSGHTGDIACDHYHLYKKDVQIMKELSLKAYRFSVSWPRIMPNGTGEVNLKGIEFYNNLIDELIKNGITPYLTLFHWDLPQALHEKGGWLNPEMPCWFEEYAKVIAKYFGDRVKHFFTINEPQCIVGLGYGNGVHAPGLKMSVRDNVRAMHNVLKAHGLAAKVLRENVKDVKIGCAPTGTSIYPADENNPADIEAARKATFEIKSEYDWNWNIAWWNDPVFLGKYPESGLKYVEKYLPESWEEDMKIICQPMDFVGNNLYSGKPVKAGENGEAEDVPFPEGYPRTAIDWFITPKALKWTVKFMHERYKLPVYVTENGMSCIDAVSLDSKVHDPNRIDFLNRYLLALREAVDEGADVAGYFQWSLMDNYEWSFGYSQRFGIVYVDYQTQERIIKDSGYWYKKVIETNGESL